MTDLSHQFKFMGDVPPQGDSTSKAVTEAQLDEKTHDQAHFEMAGQLALELRESGAPVG